jgi:GDP-L-fucose synthase
MNPKDSIFVAGHRGLAGSAICRELVRCGYSNLVTKTRAELDLLDSKAVDSFYQTHRPTHVFVAAAKVGGILANSTKPAEFLWENLQIETNLIHSAWKHGVRKLLFLGSSCIYPKHAPQPMKEEHLLTGALEPTNEWYAIAKIAGIKLCQAYRQQHGCDFISAMPTNLYGPGDNYDPTGSHVIPGLIRRFHEARVKGTPVVHCWGSGTPLREFLFSDDLAAALVLLMSEYSEEQFINVGSSLELTIRELAETIASVVGYSGKIEWDVSKPDGTPRKLMDSSRLFALGWRPKFSLRDGLAVAYQDYITKLSS